MFQCKIYFDDFSTPLTVSDEGVFFGKSWIRPYNHRLLRTIILQTADAFSVICCERFADEPHGIQLRNGLNRAEYDHYLASIDARPLDFAILGIVPGRREISYRASPVAAVPAFLLPTSAAVSIDWDSRRLLADGQFGINWDAAIAFIGGMFANGMSTVLENVYRTTAGAVATIGPAGITFRYPDAVRYDGPRETPPGADFAHDLFDTIQALIGARPLEEEGPWRS